RGRSISGGPGRPHPDDQHGSDPERYNTLWRRVVGLYLLGNRRCARTVGVPARDPWRKRASLLPKNGKAQAGRQKRTACPPKTLTVGRCVSGKVREWESKLGVHLPLWTYL